VFNLKFNNRSTTVVFKLLKSSSSQQADLTSRGRPPMPDEESGEAGPLARARVSGRSRNPTPADEVNRHGVSPVRL
jgi:hypothetical protein